MRSGMRRDAGDDHAAVAVTEKDDVVQILEEIK